jgi:hypothetical protein
MAQERGGIAPDAGRITVGEYLGLWLEDSVKTSVKPVTYEGYRQLVRKHLIRPWDATSSGTSPRRRSGVCVGQSWRKGSPRGRYSICSSYSGRPYSRRWRTASSPATLPRA